MVEGGELAADDDASVGLEGDHVHRAVRAVAGVETGVQRAAGQQPSDAVPVGAVDGGEAAAEHDGTVGLNRDGGDIAVGTGAGVEAQIDLAVRRDAGDAGDRNRIHGGEVPRDEGPAVVGIAREVVHGERVHGVVRAVARVGGVRGKVVVALRGTRGLVRRKNDDRHGAARQIDGGVGRVEEADDRRLVEFDAGIVQHDEGDELGRAVAIGPGERAAVAGVIDAGNRVGRGVTPIDLPIIHRHNAHGAAAAGDGDGGAEALEDRNRRRVDEFQRAAGRIVVDDRHRRRRRSGDLAAHRVAERNEEREVRFGDQVVDDRDVDVRAGLAVGEDHDRPGAHVIHPGERRTGVRAVRGGDLDRARAKGAAPADDGDDEVGRALVHAIRKRRQAVERIVVQDRHLIGRDTQDAADGIGQHHEEGFGRLGKRVR